MPRRVKCTDIGKVTIGYVVISCCCFFACAISGLCIDNFWLPFSYMDMNSAQVFQHGQVWRMISCYITPSSIWNCILLNMWLCLILYQFETLMGSKKMLIMLLIDIILCSLLVAAFDAFFGLIPGINSWSYFHDWWDNPNYVSNLGQSPLILIFTIQQQRIVGNKNVFCWCFEMPFLVYLLILFVMCQLMIYPPWYGVEYNVSGLIVGYLIPKKFLCQQQQIQKIDIEQPQYQNNSYAQQAQQPKPQETQQQQTPKQQWKGKSHTL